MSAPVVRIPQWAGIAGLADDGRSLATARSIIANGAGPETVEVKRRTRNGTIAVAGVRLRDHRRWLRAQPWARFMAASAAAEREKRQRRSPKRRTK
jgi:hypothetical protein